MKHHRFRQFFLIVLFLSIIYFPLLNVKNTFLKDTENTENRQPAPMPVLSLKKLDPFPLQFERYYSDHFSLRQRLMKSYYDFNLALYHKTPNPDQVVIGKNNWLFYGGNEVDTYTGKNRLTQEELQTLTKELEYRKQFLASLGTQFFFVVAPIKSSVYSAFFPENFIQLNKESIGLQLVRYLSENSSVNCINLFDLFGENGQQDLLYYKNDNHWNQKGAFMASQMIVQKIHHEFPQIPSIQSESMEIKTTTATTGNLTKMLSNTTLFTDTLFELIPKNGFKSKEQPLVGYPVVDGFPYPWEYEMVRETGDTSLPRLLIISDSFGGHIFPFLSESFSRTVKIFDSWQYKLNEEIVASEKPDIVILIVLESNLRNMFEYLSIDHKSQKK